MSIDDVADELMRTNMDLFNAAYREATLGGWGKPSGGGREHYFTETGRSACGMVGRDPAAKLRPINAPESGPRCSRCRAKLADDDFVRGIAKRL